MRFIVTGFLMKVKKIAKDGPHVNFADQTPHAFFGICGEELAAANDEHYDPTPDLPYPFSGS